ncbi:hypothetical protein LX32DRAFT_635220, partial [Colletotrichum zoysiae]
MAGLSVAFVCLMFPVGLAQQQHTAAEVGRRYKSRSREERGSVAQGSGKKGRIDDDDNDDEEDEEGNSIGNELPVPKRVNERTRRRSRSS